MSLSLIFGVLKAGLELWNTKEGNKYLDRVIKLEKQYYEELDKRSNGRKYSQLKLDRIMRELETISESFVKFSSKK